MDSPTPKNSARRPASVWAPAPSATPRGTTPRTNLRTAQAPQRSSRTTSSVLTSQRSHAAGIVIDGEHVDLDDAASLHEIAEPAAEVVRVVEAPEQRGVGGGTNLDGARAVGVGVEGHSHRCSRFCFHSATSRSYSI